MTRTARSHPNPSGRRSHLPSGHGLSNNLDNEVFLHGFRRALLIAAGFAGVALVGLLDHQTACRFSFNLFYLIPVAACAWQGGFACGILVALAGAGAWHVVDSFQHAGLPPVALAWNGIVRFSILTLVSSLVSRLHVGIRREQLLACTDALTGAANGRTFYLTASVEAERARRAGRPLTLAYFDLDNFKQLNDQRGHAAGDEALRQVVGTIRTNLRRTDLLARMGGDEFALLLPETGAAGAVALLGRLQGVLSREMARCSWPTSLSLGAITFFQPPADVDLMIQQVDNLMYQAKRKGKGRFEHAVVEGPTEPEEGGRSVQRRATALVLGNCTARVRPEGQDRAREVFATVRDLNSQQIRLHLEQNYEVDTLLLIEPLAPGVMSLLARVVQVAPDKGGWDHGCELSTCLSEEEVRDWLGTVSTADALPPRADALVY